MGHGTIQHLAQIVAMQYSDCDCLLPMRDIVYHVDIEALRVLPSSLDLPVFQR